MLITVWSVRKISVYYGVVKKPWYNVRVRMGTWKNNFLASDYFYFYSPNPYIIVQSVLSCILCQSYVCQSAQRLRDCETESRNGLLNSLFKWHNPLPKPQWDISKYINQILRSPFLTDSASFWSCPCRDKDLKRRHNRILLKALLQ